MPPSSISDVDSNAAVYSPITTRDPEIWPIDLPMWDLQRSIALKKLSMARFGERIRWRCPLENILRYPRAL